jgi:excisionase family DNA binding protein
MLGISRAQAYRLVASNELPSVRLGHRVVVPLDQLDKLLRGMAPAMPLREALERMREELVEGRIRLLRDGWQPPIVFPLHNHCLRVVGRALRGQTTRKEVLEVLDGMYEVGVMRAERGDHRYRAERERWTALLRQLADTLGSEPETERG